MTGASPLYCFFYILMLSICNFIRIFLHRPFVCHWTCTVNSMFMCELWRWHTSAPHPSTFKTKVEFHCDSSLWGKKPNRKGGPLYNGCHDNHCHHPTMHWCGEEGCAGAAVTALVVRKKLLYVHESKTERGDVCMCARDRWISAMKQHGRRMRHMCVRAAANQNLHLWANRSPIHKVRQMNQIIWARVTKLSLGRHMNTKPQPNDEYILTPNDKSSAGREPTLIWNSFFCFENQLGSWAKKFASRHGSQPKGGRSHHRRHRRWIATCLMCPFAFWEYVNTWLMLIINIVHRNSAASRAEVLRFKSPCEARTSLVRSGVHVGRHTS